MHIKMKFSIKDFFSECGQIFRYAALSKMWLRHWIFPLNLDKVLKTPFL